MRGYEGPGLLFSILKLATSFLNSSEKAVKFSLTKGFKFSIYNYNGYMVFSIM